MGNHFRTSAAAFAILQAHEANALHLMTSLFQGAELLLPLVEHRCADRVPPRHTSAVIIRDSCRFNLPMICSKYRLVCIDSPRYDYERTPVQIGRDFGQVNRSAMSQCRIQVDRR